jgi:hypothetical protein
LAKNRAKELRSKLKQREGVQAANKTASATSKVDLQRQRRSRQLEETQRLLDGYDLKNLNGAVYHKPESAACSDGSVVSRRRSESRNKVSSDLSVKQIDNTGAHSIVTREQLGLIQSKYKDKGEYATLTTEQSVIKNGTFVESPQLPNEAPTSNLRENPIEGWGRGRGRGRSTSHSFGLGEVSQSSKSRQQQIKSSSPRLIESTDPSSEAVQFYLRLVYTLFDILVD